MVGGTYRPVDAIRQLAVDDVDRHELGAPARVARAIGEAEVDGIAFDGAAGIGGHAITIAGDIEVCPHFDDGRVDSTDTLGYLNPSGCESVVRVSRASAAVPCRVPRCADVHRTGVASGVLAGGDGWPGLAGFRPRDLARRDCLRGDGAAHERAAHFDAIFR